MKLHLLNAFALIVIWVSAFPLHIVAGDAAPLKVLFLGDAGHHQPRARAIQLIPVMERAGISVEYTEDLGRLTQEHLQQYDALLVYANIDELADEPAQAILRYVSEGGGYVPVHCASYCFRNQPRLIELCGAQFSRHGTGDFLTNTRSEDHPSRLAFHRS